LASNNGCPELPANLTKTLDLASRNIYFGTGVNKAKLTTKSYTNLDKLASIMLDNPGLKMKIDAHTNNVGNADANMKLSEDRATAVKNYLVTKGIEESRITTEGFGGTQPIADNTTVAGRQRNNRIEIKVDY
jgi:outer membrane protein OmpA-like peptidoglycan-associated protein